MQLLATGELARRRTLADQLIIWYNSPRNDGAQWQGIDWIVHDHGGKRRDDSTVHGCCAPSISRGPVNLTGEYWSVTAARAYYACFYATCALLLTKDISRSSHSGVIAAFRQNFVKTGLIEPEFSDAIGEAFSLRQVADYDMIGTVDEVRAADILNNAQLFVDRVVDYLNRNR